MRTLILEKSNLKTNIYIDLLKLASVRDVYYSTSIVECHQKIKSEQIKIVLVEEDLKSFTIQTFIQSLQYLELEYPLKILAIVPYSKDHPHISRMGGHQVVFLLKPFSDQQFVTHYSTLVKSADEYLSSSVKTSSEKS